LKGERINTQIEGGEKLKKKQWKPSKKFKENLQKLFSDGEVTVLAQTGENKLTIQTQNYKLIMNCKNGLDVEEI
jgi:hypothetical protein